MQQMNMSQILMKLSTKALKLENTVDKYKNKRFTFDENCIKHLELIIRELSISKLNQTLRWNPDLLTITFEVAKIDDFPVLTLR